MSWKALDWATGIRVGSPTMSPILVLLANKADEKFSHHPSVRTLATESCAARSTVLEALKRLDVEGFITRVAQYHESGAQRSSRSLHNHPDAPHLRPGPDSGPLEPSRRTTIRTAANDPAAIDARTLATWRGGHEALTRSRVCAGFGMDLEIRQSSSVTKTGRRPLPCRSPCPTSRGVTHAAKSLASAPDTPVRRVRRRAIPDHHRRTPGWN
jgi:hypothetical protein